MTQEHAARFFKAVREDAALKDRLKATTDPDSFLKIAEQRGYHFTLDELEKEISEMSHEEVASVINPGVAPRRHIMPR